MKIKRWKIPESLKAELDSHYKTAYSLALAETDPMNIAKKLTFDNLSPNVTVKELEKLLDILHALFLKEGIVGVGLEIGSGPGTFVATFANRKEVTTMYGVEACEAIIQKLMTKVVNHIAQDNTEKIIGAVGDFNHLELADDSVDFVFDFFSLHHSSDPSVTLSEIQRILKPGGIIFCLDKARANILSEDDLEALLDIEYPAEAKLAMGLPSDIPHSRRMNGEYEYRLKDWQRYFNESGFSNFTHYNVAKIGGYIPVKMLKMIVSYLPITVQAKISSLFSRSITNNLEPSNRIFRDIFPSYPREFSLLVAWKKK